MKNLVQKSPWDLMSVPYWVKWLNAGAKWCVLAPHPDDEIIMSYGFMKSWPDQGKILILTDGEYGHEAGFEHLTASELVQIRYQETLKALDAIQMKPNQVSFCGFEDGFSRSQADILRNIVPLVQSWINLLDTQIIIAPHPYELHPDHKLAGIILEKLSGNFIKLFSCYPRGLDIGDPCFELPLKPNYYEEKLNFISFYQSQYFLRKKLQDQFYQKERFYSIEQVQAYSDSINFLELDSNSDSDASIYVPEHKCFALPELKFLSDDPQSKRERVAKTIEIRVRLSGNNPWGFKTSPGESQRFDAMLSLLLTSQHTRIVDLGCGTGELLKRLKSAGINQLLGVEGQEHLANEASKQNLEIPILKRDLRDIEDIILFNDTLIISEICYYFHITEWLNLCLYFFSKAKSVIFSMRPASQVEAFLAPLLISFKLENLVIIKDESEAVKDGCLIVKCSK